MAHIWLSPLNNCDICNGEFNGVMFDAKVHGAWGNVCQSCFNSDSRAQLGIGFGQKYELTKIKGEAPNCAWLGTEGF